MSLSLYLVCLLTSADGWTEIARSEGVVVEQRDDPKLPHGEIRVRGHTPHPPKAIYETLWTHPEYPEFMPNLLSLKVIKDTGDTRWVYQRISVPIVSNRDYTLKIHRVADEANQLYQVFFDTDNAAGPAESADYVRVKSIKGSWTAEPGDNGGADLTYRVASDPGVALPSFVIENAQKNATAKAVRAMLNRVDYRVKKAASAAKP